MAHSHGRKERTPLARLHALQVRSRSCFLYAAGSGQSGAADDINGATHRESLALDAPTLLKFSWFFPNYPPTFVSFRLETAGDNATRVLFEHEGWDKFPAEQIKPIRDMLDGGWKSFVLVNLKRVAEA